jgi:ParB family transcriptional regulator, chromosome partitioning protein
MSERGSLLAGANLFEVSPAHVDEGARIGFLHEDKAAAIGRLMAVDGQRDPIKVVANPKNPDRPWRLVTGMHRLIGARIEAITVWAIEVSGKPEDLADLEASDNLHRRPLAPIERAKFVQALCQAAQERIAREHGGLSQHKLAVKARWDRVKHGESRVGDALQEESDDTADKMSAVYGWVESAADAMGLDKRTIRRSLELYRLIIEPFPELAEPLSRHPVVGENAAQLKLIAAVQSEGDRRRVIEALLADEEIGAEDARILAGIDSAGGVTPVAYQKHYNAIEGGWSRLGRTERTRFLREKFVTLLTPGEKRELRDRLTTDIGDIARERVSMGQAAGAMAETVRIVNALLEGSGVDDEQLEQLRRQAQAIVFDLPEDPADAR